MNKTDEKKRAEFYLRVSKILREASIKMGLRSALGYVFTSEERKALSDIQQIFFPEQEISTDVDYTVLNKASGTLPVSRRTSPCVFPFPYSLQFQRGSA